MLTESEIKRFIDEDIASQRKQAARVGQRYYDGEHDILNYKMYYYNADGILVEDKARANNRICHPFFSLIVDQTASYILSFDDGNPIQAKPTAEGLQDHLDAYFDAEFWAEMYETIVGTVAKGFDYLYASINPDDKLEFQHADCLGVVEIRAQDTDSNCEHIIYWYDDLTAKDRKKIRRIEVYDAENVWFYVQVDDGKIIPDDNAPMNPRPHVVWTSPKTGAKYGDGLGFVPFWRLDNNLKQSSDLKPIKALIDDHDLMQCGLSNNLQDFDHPIYLVKGYDSSDLTELQQNIKTKKILGVGEGGELDILTVDIPYQARKTKADEDAKSIYQFAMAFNPTQIGDGNITNIVIKSRYSLLDLKAKRLENRIKRFLKPIIRIVIDEINRQNGTDYQYTDVKIEFTHVIPTNEQENAQIALTEAQAEQLRVNTILQVAANIGDEAALRAICDILEMDFDELKDQLNDDTITAMETLESVVVEDE